jgi:hypothetical protein
MRAGFALFLGTLATAPRAMPQAEVPSPMELLARHELATGGRTALDRHSSVRMIGTVDIGGGELVGTVEILRAKPDKFVQKMHLARLGDIWRGFDGKVAWVIEMSTPGLLTDTDAQSMRNHAQWHHLFLAPIGLQIGRVDSTEFEGQPAWKVTFAGELGVEVQTYFSRATGLRVAQVMGDNATIESDYREFGGVKMPTRIVTRSVAGEMVMVIDKVEFDKVVPAAFELPPAIRAIAK